MNARENLLSLLKREGYARAPVYFELCPSQIEVFKEKTSSKNEDYQEYFDMPWRFVADMKLKKDSTGEFRKYYDFELKKGSKIDLWGVAHEPGSKAAKHMTYMRNPMRGFDSIQQMQEYPFPDFENASNEHQEKQVKEIHSKGLASVGLMACTVWEASWYLRSMEELMMDMMTEDKKAEFLLDRVTQLSCIRAESYAKAGVDVLFIGDDIGCQSTIMMSLDMFRTWIKPRLKRIIDIAKRTKPDILVMYHSCGYITPFIYDLIEIGIDILNPIQPECMDFKEIHKEFGEKLSFHGTIGTQSTMPFGTAKDVKKEVFRNLEIAGDKGGLFCAPTHLVEPEVPWENILAYVDACKEFTK